MFSVPQKLFQAEDVKRCETLLAKKHQIPLFSLMQKAGEAVYRVCQRYANINKVLVLTGTGNNGGDGYIVAQHYHQIGVDIDVFTGSCSTLSENAKRAAAMYRGRCISTFPSEDELNKYDVIIDGLLGTGLNRPLSAEFATIINLINQSTTVKIAIDVPSGLHADTGQPMPIAIQADCTVAMIAVKPGLVTGSGVDYTGKLLLAELGIGHELESLTPVFAESLSIDNLPRLPLRNLNSHKTQCGKLLCVGGSELMPGAILLSAIAAFRVGTGMVKVSCHPSNRALMVTSQPEIMLADDTNLLPHLRWATAVVLGPGMGLTACSSDQFMDAMSYCSHYQLPVVIDGDALSFLSQHNGGYDLSSAVITPHSGEAARLMDISVADVENDRYQTALDLAKKYQCHVVLKGPGSIMVNHGKLAVCRHGNPGMSSAGMGDVLAGILGGFLAQGLSLESATKYATLLHSKAADIRVEKYGQRGILASDLFVEVTNLLNN